MQSQNGKGWQETKKRLQDLLKTAVGGVVIASTTLTTPVVSAPTTAAPENGVLAERVKEVRDQVAKTAAPGDVAEDALAWHNWGNHWSNWNNWHNWGNWHNW